MPLHTNLREVVSDYGTEISAADFLPSQNPLRDEIKAIVKLNPEKMIVARYVGTTILGIFERLMNRHMHGPSKSGAGVWPRFLSMVIRYLDLEEVIKHQSHNISRPRCLGELDSRRQHRRRLRRERRGTGNRRCTGEVDVQLTTQRRARLQTIHMLPKP